MMRSVVILGNAWGVNSFHTATGLFEGNQYNYNQVEHMLWCRRKHILKQWRWWSEKERRKVPPVACNNNCTAELFQQELFLEVNSAFVVRLPSAVYTQGFGALHQLYRYFILTRRVSWDWNMFNMLPGVESPQTGSKQHPAMGSFGQLKGEWHWTRHDSGISWPTWAIEASC